MRYNESDHSGTLNSATGGTGNTANFVKDGWTIRRLTPTEGERLQGLPDGWTKFGVFEKQVWTDKKKKTFRIVEGVEQISDAQRYKLIGNGITKTVAQIICEKLYRHLPHQK